MTDYVVTFVDGNEPVWRKGYEKICRRLSISPSFGERFRDWGFLRYILRGIEKNMPWIRKVHIVVEGESQIPEWVNTSMLNIVTHKQIIPEEYLPTYNSTCIEMFLYRIPDLAEQFIYGNDDMLSIGSLEESDFFENGKPKILIVHKPWNRFMPMYRHHLKNGERLVRRVLDLPPNEHYRIQTGHNLSPMLKSTWEALWEKEGDVLKKSLSPFREYRNINQEVANYWHILSEDMLQSERRTTYLEMNDMDKVVNTIRHSDSQLVCLNDAQCIRFEDSKKRIDAAFLKKYPDKSKYEL